MKTRHKKKIRFYYRRLRLSMIRAMRISALICAFMLPSYVKFEESGDNYFKVSYEGTQIGVVDSRETLDHYVVEARKRLAKESDELVLVDTDFTVEGQQVLIGEIDAKEDVIERMMAVMEQNKKDILKRSYTVKINESTVNLCCYQDVQQLLEETVAPYDEKHQFQPKLELDPAREVNVLTAKIYPKDEIEEEEETRLSAGIGYELDKMLEHVEPAGEKAFADYYQGLIDIGYADKIEVIESYLLEEARTPVDEAINMVTKEQETQKIYKVVPGDSLSKISLENNIPVDKLIAINDAIEDEFSTIRVDQEIVINVPEPDLSVIWKDERVYVEDYEAEIQYVDNDNWYTTQQVTLQAPSAGRREVVAVTTYRNTTEIDKEILDEKVYAEAVPKIIERGTKIPPTYVKPISGGRRSSGFGARSAPTKGASTNHKGIDWAVAIGTPVVASNGGVVAAAGWMSGYGYAVYINHADGRQTRYGHLSKVLVSPGQRVSQGQRIALSGNSGRSTGPHLHFEIRINGQAVNPLKYLN